MTEHQHDAFVDRAARTFTAAEPRHDLRRQVLSRLEPQDGPSSFAWMRSGAVMRIAAAAAVVAVIGVAFLVPRAPVREPASSGMPGPPLASAAPRPQTTPQPILDAPPAEPGRPAVRRRARTAPMTAAEQAWATRMLPALEQPDAVTVTPIQPEAVTIALLDLKPLTIAPIGAADGGRD